MTLDFFMLMHRNVKFQVLPVSQCNMHILLPEMVSIQSGISLHKL